MGLGGGGGGWRGLVGEGRRGELMKFCSKDGQLKVCESKGGCCECDCECSLTVCIFNLTCYLDQIWISRTHWQVDTLSRCAIINRERAIVREQANMDARTAIATPKRKHIQAQSFAWIVS